MSVWIYDDADGVPDESAELCAGRVRRDGPSYVVRLDEPCTLAAGSYRLVVQVAEKYSVGGWFWKTTSQEGAADQWKNPGDWFDTGCTTWGSVPDCVGVKVDYRFKLRQ